MKGWTDILFFAIIFTFTSFVISVTPLYYFDSTYIPENNFVDPVAFHELNIDTKTLKTLANITFTDKNDEYFNEFFGTVVYYKTGVLYSNYWKRIGFNQYQSYLLAVDTPTGKLLFKDFQFCEGFVSSGIAIDQTNGDIHFLNHSSSFQSTGLTVDWTKWNIETNLTTIIQSNANTNANPYGAVVYNDLTSTLWTLDTTMIAYTPNSPYINYTTPDYWNHLTIDSNSRDLYVTSLESFALLRVGFNSTNVFASSLVCQFDATGYAFVTSADGADFDYVSNTWVISLDEMSSEKYGGPYNVIFYVNIDTCDYDYFYQSSQDNYISQSVPRFNSGAAY